MHHQNELCEGLGRGVSPANGYLHSVLDRTSPQRTAAVARPGPHADGFAGDAMLVDDVSQRTDEQTTLRYLDRSRNKFKATGFQF